jgi:hypothetical protein
MAKAYIITLKTIFILEVGEMTNSMVKEFTCMPMDKFMMD